MKRLYIVESDSPLNPHLYCENDVNHLLFSCEKPLIVSGNCNNQKVIYYDGSIASLAKKISLELSKDQIEILIYSLTEIYEDTLESE
jgi:hypothetical protein